MKPPILQVKKVCFAYQDNIVLEDLNVEVTEGELVGVVGPNGSGKTTLLQLISGVLQPSQGEIIINGNNLTTFKPTQRARLISIVPQNPQLPLNFTVLDLVLMGRNPHLKLLQWEQPEDLEIARLTMRITNTDHLANRSLYSLSGGERQRATLAMALAQEAPILLLDEPTSNLDITYQTNVMNLIRDVSSKRSGAVLLTMHDLTLAAQYCSRLIMIAEGRSYVEGPPNKVLTPENISYVYGSNVRVLSHPDKNTPIVLPASDHETQV